MGLFLELSVVESPGPLFMGSVTCTLRKRLPVSQAGSMGLAPPKKLGGGLSWSVKDKEDTRRRGHAPSSEGGGKSWF